MTQSSPVFNPWLNANGPEQIIGILTDLVDLGAFFAVDGEGRILFWSKGAEKLFGSPANKVFGRFCTEILGCDGEHDPCGLQALGSIKSQLVQVKHANGERLLCYLTGRAIYDAEGHLAGALEFLQPVAAASDSAVQESFHGIISRDPLMLEAIKIIRNVAETETTVLIRGESGTGKELVAKALHLESPRYQQPFLAINCAALTPSLLESELFGHVKGAFTGALRAHAGLFQRANRGTLFLDEVAELPLELQAKLLRVLQEQSFIPVGGDDAINVDVRIIAATHRSLREEVKAGRFREDLMYRLRVVPIFLPPLRERRQDVNLLLWHFIQRHNAYGRRHIETVAPEAMRRLLDYAWPGNVRELINVVAYVFAVGRGSELALDDLPPEFRETVSPLAHDTKNPPRHSVAQHEAQLIGEALQLNAGNLDAAARQLGMSRATFWRKRKKHGL